MELDSRAHVYITYLSLALKICFPSLPSLPLDVTLKGYDERLQAIENRLDLGIPDPMIELTANDLSHRAAVAYGYYTGRWPRLIKITVNVASSKLQMTPSPLPPKSPVEERAFRDQIERITLNTRSNGRRLPDSLPADITWDYLDAWEKALECSPPPSPRMFEAKEWPVPLYNVINASRGRSTSSTVFTDLDEAFIETPQDSDMGSDEGIAWN